MKIKLRRNHGLAFFAALIVFCLVIAVVGLAIAILAKIAQKAVTPGGPNKDTPITDTSIPFTDIPKITPADAAALMAASSSSNSEFEFRVLRSTNLVDWEEIIHTNTIDHKLLWADPNPPYPNGFYLPQIYIPQ